MLADILSRISSKRISNKNYNEETHRLKATYEDTIQAPIKLSIIADHQSKNTLLLGLFIEERRGDIELCAIKEG